jgi:putative serine protease PepD
VDRYFRRLQRYGKSFAARRPHRHPHPLALAAFTLTLALCACGSGGAAPAAHPLKIASPAAALQHQLVKVVDTVSPSVVQIETGSGLGSGVVYDGNGNIVTNAHVVGSARTFSVTLASGRVHAATLVGTFVPGDLAVIRLNGASPRPASFAADSSVTVGDIVLAIGNPLGLRSSVTEGIVSSVGRTVSEGNGVALPSVIQTSAAINPGNSGGALVDLRGEVIGIPTLAALDPVFGGSPAPGIGFAIPSSYVRRIADQLIRDGRVVRSQRALLGARVTTIVGGGVLVAGVTPHGPAADAGIRPGDVIVDVDGKPTPSTDALAAVLAQLKPGQRVRVSIIRGGGARRVVHVKLGELTTP